MMSAPPSNKNVEQTLSTSREEVMTFSYDMSLEPEFEKPTYPGTGNGLGGEEGEYDVRARGGSGGGSGGDSGGGERPPLTRPTAGSGPPPIHPPR